MEVLKIGSVAPADDVLARRHRRLDADHVCTPVGQMTNAGRARAREREIEDEDIGERQFGLHGMLLLRRVPVNERIMHQALPLELFKSASGEAQACHTP
jgi:hypothetical protein